MKTLLFIFFAGSVAFSQPMTVTNLVQDDEGVKVLAKDSSEKLVVAYLKNENKKFQKIFDQLKEAKTNQNKINLVIQKKDLNLVTDTKDLQ